MKRTITAFLLLLFLVPHAKSQQHQLQIGLYAEPTARLMYLPGLDVSKRIYTGTAFGVQGTVNWNKHWDVRVGLGYAMLVPDETTLLRPLSIGPFSPEDYSHKRYHALDFHPQLRFLPFTDGVVRPYAAAGFNIQTRLWEAQSDFPIELLILLPEPPVFTVSSAATMGVAFQLGKAISFDLEANLRYRLDKDHEGHNNVRGGIGSSINFSF